MTIGERIKHFRTRLGITQSKLAEISGLHPVSIRKYETNKMVPQTAQIEKLAEALDVSSFALAGFDNNISLETVGDFMGLLIMFLKTKIISIQGERDDKGMLKADTVSFKLNPFITNFFDIKSNGKEIDSNSILCYLKHERILSDILKWEKINHRYESCVAQGDPDDKDLQHILNELKEMIDTIEMELQCSDVILNDGDGICVRIPPDSIN